MPVKTGNKVGKNGKPFNPSVGHGFGDDRFGKDSVLVRIDADGLKAVTENLQIGSTILLRYNKVTTQGNKHYFVEILPPRKEGEGFKKSATTSVLD